MEKEEEISADRWKVIGTGMRGNLLAIYGRECAITIEPRPAHCDRGNLIANLFPHPCSQLDLEIIGCADGWPRYYFDLARAKLEIEAWLVKRGQWVEATPAPGESPR